MRLRSLSLIALAGVYLACGGDSGGGPNPGGNLLSKQSGDNQVGTVNSTLAADFCAKVTKSGAAESGVTVNWSTSGGGTMTPPSDVTGADGIACSRLTLGTGAGSQSALAAVTGASGSPVTFSATANAGNAANLAKGTGDNQTGTINLALANPLTATVTDQFGNAVAGTQVDWAVTSGTATPAPLSSNTNAAGTASTTITLGGTAGPIVITASSGTLVGSPVTFNATANTPTPPPSAITITVQNPGSFSPVVDTVAAGGTVTWDWANTGLTTHSVTSTGPTSFISDPAGATASPHSYGPITFNTPGTYFYYCTVHGSAGNPPTGMSGTIVVQ